MSKCTVDVFVEDKSQREFLAAMIRRVADESGVRISVSVKHAAGGQAKVFSELKLYQKLVKLGVAPMPDILVVGIDANCKGFHHVRKEIQDGLVDEFRPRTVIACPDPHVERWYMIDPASFHAVVGKQPKIEKMKCDKDRYKTLLMQAIRSAGHVSPLDGVDFAPELVAAMDLYRAGKEDNALKIFIQDLKAALRGER